MTGRLAGKTVVVRVVVRGFLAVALVAVVAVAAAPATRPAAPSQPHVLVIGDSVATAIYWHAPAVAALQKNLAVEWQVAVCRTLIGPSCPFGGTRAENALDTIDSMPSVPPVVVVEMGYNDAEDSFATAVDETMLALIARGAQHVLWLTLAATRPPYPHLDEILAGAAQRYSQLELVDWDSYSFGHPAWFQTDLVHLTLAGGLAMAHLVHACIVALTTPLRAQAATLPTLRRGRAYRARLLARGGTPPYRWSPASGKPPRGVHLLPDGVLWGKPASTATMDFVARVVDADGVKAWTTVYARNASP